MRYSLCDIFIPFLDLFLWFSSTDWFFIVFIVLYEVYYMAIQYMRVTFIKNYMVIQKMGVTFKKRRHVFRHKSEVWSLQYRVKRLNIFENVNLSDLN